MQVLWVILRKTYGFQKKTDRIALSQFSLATGKAKSNVCRGLRKLLSMRIIIKSDNTTPTTYRFNKNFDEWKPLSNRTPIIKSDNQGVSMRTHTKDTLTKDKEKRVAASPPTRKYNTGAERSELQGDCISYVSLQLMKRWSELTKETASLYAGYAVKHLNTDAFSLEPEQFWWLLETKMNLPETPGEWYAFVGTSKKQIEMQWASDARNAVPLSPRSGQERIGT